MVKKAYAEVLGKSNITFDLKVDGKLQMCIFEDVLHELDPGCGAVSLVHMKGTNITRTTDSIPGD